MYIFILMFIVYSLYCPKCNLFLNVIYIYLMSIDNQVIYLNSIRSIIIMIFAQEKFNFFCFGNWNFLYLY